ncbi:uncharacterized protein TNIN_221601 [Trichonephila inaurata madagascariensis]|uniref:Uncharacterized protein n=1 Tax=Trichonephila inaurata madagascariensis TaxID=2747483 RepID=A0A8X6I7E0_9ARAC|nr:uncharacterized protein TNIN_221601 [Trichonephila inaurata madagascariensis]
MRQCICQICICGRHHCEHTKIKQQRVPFAKDKDDANKITEHKDRYRHFGYHPPESPIKPSSGADWKGNEPSVKLSTAKHDYVPLPIERRSPMRPKQHKEPKGKMECSTTYQQDYKPKKGHKSKIKLPKTESSKDGTMPGTMPGKIEGITTYGRSYVPKESSIREPVKIKECTLTKLGQPFRSDTETARSYQAPPYQKRELMPGREGELKLEGDFEVPKWHPSRKQQQTFDGGPMSGQTTYKTDYEPPPEDIYEPPAEKKPIKNNLTIPSGPMEKTTTTMRDFPRIDNPVLSQSFRPDSQYKKPEGKFAHCTTTGCDYTPKTAEKTEKIKQEDNLGKEEGQMEDFSTTMRDFQGICVDCPAKYIKLYGKDALLPQYKFEKTEKGHDYFKKLKNKGKS